MSVDSYGSGGLVHIPQMAATQQIVYLDFDGELTSYNGEILTIDNVEVQDSSLTGERIENILAELNARYASQNVIFVTERPEETEYSTIYIGKSTSFDAYGNFAGVAETIDHGNENRSDNAFVMLDSISSDEQIISTISHETDHLLGTLDHGGEGLTAYAYTTYISSGVTSNGLKLSNGHILVVNSAGTANNTTAAKEGYMHVKAGGIASRTIITRAGMLYISSGGKTCYTSISSGGVEYVYDGGIASFTSIGSKGQQIIYSGGTTFGTTLYSSGHLTVLSGGTALMVDWTPCIGNLEVGKGGVITYSVDRHGVYFGASDMLISTGWTMNNKVVDGPYNNASMYVMKSGTVNNTNVLDSFLSVNAGGRANVTTLYSSGTLLVSSGGVASGVTINSGCSIEVLSGGTATNIATSAYAKLHFTVAPDTYIQGSYLNSAFEIKNAAVSNYTINSACILHVENGGKANAVTVDYRGVFCISGGGTANAAMVSRGGTMYVESTGVANRTQIFSSGNLDILSGGVANSTTLNSGGSMYIYYGGVANNTTVNSSGYMYISSGGIHRGSLQIASGAVVSAYSGAIIDFTVSDRTSSDDYLINDFSLISGTPTYTITVSDDQAEGTYKLAQGASSFSGSISIGDGTTSYGSITVNGEDLVYNGVTYTLTQNSGNLTLQISEKVTDNIPPELTISGNVTEWTNQDVVLIATVNEESTILYQIGNGQWLTYTNGVTVSANATVNFKATDLTGNVTVKSVTIDKIDKTAPVLEISGNVTEWTNEDVTLTASVNEESTILYQINGGQWQTYTYGVTVTANGVVNFKATDLAGNVTEKSVTVDKIDKTAPDAPIGVASTTEPTNEDVTIAVTYSSDSVVRQYKIGNGQWLDYTEKFAVSANCMVYFRCEDAVGNVNVSSLAVNNIDKIPPGDPVISVNIATPTISNVIVRAAYSSDAVVRQYKIGENGSWQDYSDSFTVEENAVLYFRSVDHVGNASEYEYVISNIDRTAPDAPVASWDTTPTNGNVTVTVVYSSDSVVKQYKIGENGSWQNYYNPFTVAENTMLYFRCEDAAGNVSESSGQIREIDRIAPEAPVLSINNTAMTNENVIITAEFCEDTAVKEYSLDGENWTAFADTVTVTENCTLFFRGKDAAGNISPVVSFNVTNIDKTAPVVPAVTANITEVTSGNVFLTAKYSNDSIIREYSLDGIGWQDYTYGITVGFNCEVFFRGKDAAGNISDVTSYKVENIVGNGKALLYGRDKYGRENTLVSAGRDLFSKEVGSSCSRMEVWNGGRAVNTTVNANGAVILSAGAMASKTTINSAGALHVYSGGVASQTTVNQSGYLGIGLGATAYDTTIGYAGELTVWGGGVVSRNTIDTWGAIILSSGALAKDTVVNSLGGLHVYNGAVASNTTIKEGGVLGAGYGATVYETKLDSFGKATLWGGAVASNTSIGYAGELTVLSGGLADTNVIDTWGAVILSSGAIGNSTTILASGGYHIYKGAVAYTTMVTSGANLGIGLGGTVYNLNIELGANATFYDGSILRGWSDFAGTVTVNAGVDAAGSMINFDITERSSSDGVIISNVAGITGTSYFVTVDATQSAGRYYLAGNAASIASLTITGTSNVLTTNGAGVALNGNTYSLGLDAGNNLYLDIAKTAGAMEDWDVMDLGSWDDVETGAAANLTDGAEEKKGDGFLAIA